MTAAQLHTDTNTHIHKYIYRIHRSIKKPVFQMLVFKAVLTLPSQNKYTQIVEIITPDVILKYK